MDSVWEEYKRRRRAVWLAFLSFPFWIIPLAAIGDILRRIGFPRNSWVELPFLGAPLVFVAVVHLRFWFWPCPRCGRPFRSKWCGNGYFARRCLHCGLPKWAPGPDCELAKTASPGACPDPSVAGTWDRD